MGFFNRNNPKPSGSPHEIVQPQIRFICEQDGQPEQKLKREMSLLFNQNDKVARAYLVRVAYDESNTYNVALCLRTKDDIEDLEIVNYVSSVFVGIFASACYLDILFLSHEKEEELKEVCLPFFDRYEEF